MRELWLADNIAYPTAACRSSRCIHLAMSILLHRAVPIAGVGFPKYDLDSDRPTSVGALDLSSLSSPMSSDPSLLELTALPENHQAWLPIRPRCGPDGRGSPRLPNLEPRRPAGQIPRALAARARAARVRAGCSWQRIKLRQRRWEAGVAALGREAGAAWKGGDGMEDELSSSRIFLDLINFFSRS